MATKDDANQVSINAMLKSNKIDLNMMTYLKHTHNIEDLIKDKTDLISAYISKAPYLLKQNFISYNVFSPSDYGFDMYSDFLFTNKELNINSPQLVESFRRASIKGWEYAFSHIGESSKLIVDKYNNQNLSTNELIYEGKVLKEIAYYHHNNLGDINKLKLKRIVDLYNIMGYLNNNSINDINDFYYKNNLTSFTKEEQILLKDKDTFKICVQSNNYPFEEISNNKVNGIFAIYKTIFENLLNKNFIIVPSKNKQTSEEYLKNKKCDLISFSKNNSSNLVKTKDYLNLPLVLVTKDEKEFIYNFEQLKNKRISIYNSNLDIKEINKKYPNIKIDNNIKKNIDKLLNNQLYGIITNIADATNILKQQSFGQIRISGSFDKNFSLHLQVRKEDQILKDIFNKIIINISKNEQDKLLEEFTSLNYQKVTDYKVIWQVVIVSIGLILILILFIYREEKFKYKILELNKNLRVKIKNEVAINRKKDEYMFNQSKLASMGEMITNIAHQWRQPLNRISLSAQVMDSLIQDETFKNKEILEKKVSIIKKSVIYMSNTINDFNDFFHPNKMITLFNLNNTVLKSFDLLKNNNVKFNLNINEKINLTNYENELIQVIIVLLNNSIDAFNKNNINDSQINLYVKEFNKKIELSIADNAGGIDSKIIHRIFEPYFSTKFEEQGIGIGLYMAKMLVEESMGGEIFVESFDKQTHFMIVLPRINNE